MPAHASTAALPVTRPSDRDAVVALADRTKHRLSGALTEARRWRLGDSEVLRGRTQPTRLAAPAG